MEDLNKLRDIDALQIKLASPEDILSWSYGEVTKPETINYRTFKPEKDGLFCEKIFGPVKDYECSCGKYKRIRYKGVICDRCGVQVTTAKVRRERMGHINLSSPVVHVWFFKNIPSILATLLGIPPRSLELVIYFSSFIVTDIDYEAKEEVMEKIDEDIEKAKEEVRSGVEVETTSVKEEAEKKIKSLSKDPEEKWDEKLKGKAGKIRIKAQDSVSAIREQLVKEEEKAEIEVRKIYKKLEEVDMHTIMADREFIALEKYLDEFCELKIGAEAIQTILDEIDLDAMAKEVKEELAKAKSTKAEKLRKRIKVINSMRKGGVNPSSMVVTALPVVPPDLRPMVQLEGNRFATSDLNDLYRRIINRNNRLKRLLDLGAPDIIVRNEKRMLQESVDALIDSSKVRKSRTRDRKTYRSLADQIKGKQGYFRANLLGKRVDYSGRAVIVSGPQLKVDECGIPTEMALELFRPFLIREIMTKGLAPNMKTAKGVLEEKPPEIYSILEELVLERPVLLNRAPTLHKLSVQAFNIKLTDGKAIQLHPVVCSGFNADFDGDQMAVHLPLSEKAVQEARELMISTKNLLKPADGSVVTIPSHEMVLGLYYLTSVNEHLKLSKTVFADRDEVLRAHGSGKIDLRQKMKVNLDGGIIETTAGRIIFNEFVPEELGYVNTVLSKGEVKKLVGLSLEKAGVERTVNLIDKMKYNGFLYSTLSGISLSITDCEAPATLDKSLKEAHKEIEKIEQNYQMGLITQTEMSTLSRRVWSDVIDHFDETVLDGMDFENPVSLIISAGAGKASAMQMRQITAMKGLVASPEGKLIDMPVLGNFATGLSSFDYFLNGRGTRRNYMDKGLGTADAGYLTRRLVNIAQDVLIREDDCGTKEGRVITKKEDTPLHAWHERLAYRYAQEDVKDGKKVLVKAGELITSNIAKTIGESKVESVKIRSPLSCDAKYGVCKKCYGLDLSDMEEVGLGAAVGIIAAQSIGEPGTQLTMNVFHSGGVAGSNITQGLPRVEELFEARKPKSQALISMVAGKVSLEELDDGFINIVIKPTDKDQEEVIYKANPSDEILVGEGDLVGAGTNITEGPVNLQELYEAVGPDKCKQYILDEVQKVYGSQGVSISDVHVEVIIRQMFNRVRISKAGDTNLLPGDIVTVFKFEAENKVVKKLGGEKAVAKPLLLGISKVSRMSESWLDAASFEETSVVLTESAVAAKIDPLIGLKENVIIGHKIPVGEDARIEESVESKE